MSTADALTFLRSQPTADDRVPATMSTASPTPSPRSPASRSTPTSPSRPSPELQRTSTTPGSTPAATIAPKVHPNDPPSSPTRPHLPSRRQARRQRPRKPLLPRSRQEPRRPPRPRLPCLAFPLPVRTPSPPALHPPLRHHLHPHLLAQQVEITRFRCDDRRRHPFLPADRRIEAWRGVAAAGPAAASALRQNWQKRAQWFEIKGVLFL